MLVWEKREKKPKEFTKTMYKFNVIFATVVTILSFALMLYSAFVDHIDISAIAYIVPPVWVEIGVFSGFYVWKAKNENISKYGKNAPTEYFEGEYFNGLSEGEFESGK